MYDVVKKRLLAPTIVLLEVDAPAVAAKVEPGQFVIVRVDELGERIPLTVMDFDREKRDHHACCARCGIFFSPHYAHE